MLSLTTPYNLLVVYQQLHTTSHLMLLLMVIVQYHLSG
jgi:hypothetical protein